MMHGCDALSLGNGNEVYCKRRANKQGSHGHIKVAHKSLFLSFPQVKRTCLPAGRSGSPPKGRKYSGQAGMRDRDIDLRGILHCQQ
jgi:hypothetical protein